MPTENPREMADSEDSVLFPFVTAYEEALAAGLPLPSADSLTPAARTRWERMRGALHLLARTAQSSGSGTARALLDDPTPAPAEERACATPGGAATFVLHRGNRPQARLPEKPLGRFGRFKLLTELGRGGMGVVYLAHDPELDRLVAIKTIAAAGRNERKRQFRFEAEGRLLARQRHPNIVQVHETGEEQGQPYFVMEYVEGPSLGQKLGGRPMNPREAAALLEALARAVGHAHRAGIIHRDLKPANVLLAVDGTPKISDFGLATTLDHSFDLTRTGELVGTPVYMAPEMATAEARAGPSVDVYGLGAILYETLTGHPPFVGVDAFFILSQVQHADPVSPRQLNPQVPADLETICLKCLEKDPHRRYPGADALADDLRRLLDNRPILARPVGPIERAVKFARRRPAVAAAWGISCAAIVAILSVVLVYNVQLTDERDRAVRGEESARTAQEKTEDALVERNATLGLSAERAGNLPEAALWFAVAARQSRAGSAGEQTNRTRWQTYTAGSPVPWRAIRVPGADRLGWLGLHPTGRWLIVGSKDQVDGWTLWDLAGERPLPWPGDLRNVSAAAWSADGCLLATGTKDGAIQVVRFQDGNIINATQVNGPVECLTFDPAGRYLAAADGTHRLSVHALKGSPRVIMEHAHPARIIALAFSPGSTRLSTFTGDEIRAFALEGDEQGPRLLLGPVKGYHTRGAYPSDEGPGFLSNDELVTSDQTGVSVWDLSTQKLKKQFPGGAYREGGIGVSTSGRYVIVWRHLQEPELWQVADDRAAADRTIRAPPAETVAIRPDGERFLLGSKNGLQLWNRDRSPASGVLWHHSLPHPLAWSADGRWFVTGGGQGVVRLWRAQEDRPISAQLPVPPQGALPIVFALCRDGNHVLTATHKDGQSEFQSSSLDGGKAAGPLVRLPGQPTGVDFSPDSKTVYAVTAGKGRGWLHSWNHATGQPVFPGVELPFPPYDVACRPDGGALALAGGDDSEVELRVASTGALISHKPTDKPQAVAMFVTDRVRFAPDGRTFITFGRSDRVWEWDARDGNFLRHFALPKENRCVDARYSFDGRYLATASTNGHSALVWDVQSGSLAASLSHPDFVFSARFDGSGARLVTACRDGKTRVWDWRAGQLALPALAQNEEVTDAAFSPDGRWIASAEAGGRARIWDASQALPLAPGWPLQPPGEPFLYFANRLEFSRDGRRLLVGVRRHRLLVFDLTVVAAPPSGELAPDDMVLLAEINAGAAIVPGSSVESLATEQWFQRWQQFRRRHPDFHRMPETSSSAPGRSVPNP